MFRRFERLNIQWVESATNSASASDAFQLRSVDHLSLREHNRAVPGGTLKILHQYRVRQGALGACCAESAAYKGLLCLSPLNDLGRCDNIRPFSEQAIEKTGVQFRVAVRASVTDNQNAVVLVHRLQCGAQRRW